MRWPSEAVGPRLPPYYSLRLITILVFIIFAYTEQFTIFCTLYFLLILFRKLSSIIEFSRAFDNKRSDCPCTHFSIFSCMAVMLNFKENTSPLLLLSTVCSPFFFFNRYFEKKSSFILDRGDCYSLK